MKPGRHNLENSIKYKYQYKKKEGFRAHETYMQSDYQLYMQIAH